MKVRGYLRALFLAVAFIVGAVASPMAMAATAPATPVAAGASVEPGFETIAESKVLKLYFNSTNSQLAIEDKRNGYVWHSNPVLKSSVGEIGELWQQQVGSIFGIQYTTESRDTTQMTNSSQENPKMRVTKIKGGVAVTYDLTNLEMRFTLEYTLKDDSLQVKLPEKSIREKMTAPLVSMEFLPFMGAASDDEQGYAFFPDGAGAISHFKKIHPTYNQMYSEPIYGADQFSFPAWDTQMGSVQTEKERIQLPVFGLAKGKNAFVGTVVAGDGDAKVNFSPSGYVVNYTRVSAEFLFRKNFQAAMRRNVYADRVEKRRIVGDRAVRYTFLANADANYVGMAKAYRKYLMEDRGVKKLPAAKKDMPFSLRVFDGVQTKGVLLMSLLKMTSFDEAKTIVESLEKRGIKNIELTMVGWNKQGFNGLAPKHMPADAKFGGDKGLKNLVEWADKRGYPTYLQDDFLNAFGGNGGFVSRTDTARGTNKMPYLEPGQRNYLLNPYISLNKFAKKVLPDLADKYKAKGVELRYAGKMVLTDRNLKHRMDRQDWINYWLKIVDEARKNFKLVASQGGNAYVLGKVDRIVDAPMESNEYLFSDERVPFFQIATHGLVTYTGYPGNLRSDYTREFLRDLEYGAIPVWEFAYKLSLDLKDTAYNKLYSYLYTDWLDDASREYKILNNGLGRTYSMFIQNHEKLAKDVFVTTFEDGSKIYVNYNEQPYSKGGLVVKALGYKIVKGR